jgi:hypothetical protein
VSLARQTLLLSCGHDDKTPGVDRPMVGRRWELVVSFSNRRGRDEPAGEGKPWGGELAKRPGI